MSYIQTMRASAVTVIFAAELFQACRDQPPPVNEPAATIVVYGRVSAPNGGPAPRAFMSLAAHANGSCAGPLVDIVNAFTSASGDYRAALHSSTRLLPPTNAAYLTQPAVCVSVNAAPPDGSRFQTTSAHLAPVVMRSDALDSVRVDVELQLKQ